MHDVKMLLVICAMSLVYLLLACLLLLAIWGIGGPCHLLVSWAALSSHPREAHCGEAAP
jgi:hypothetical protein